MSIPYIYLLFHRSTKMYYVGVQYGKNANPKNFWVSYFTSSKTVHKLIALYGVNDFRYRIVKTFDKSGDAILQEHKWTMRAIHKKHYINAAAGVAVRPDICAMAGKIGGLTQYHNRQGFHKFSIEEHRAAASKGGKKGAFTQSKWQSEFGKRGGVKNKGKFYINNGLDERKLNPNEKIPNGWSRGRSPKVVKSRRWVNDGLRNYFVLPEKAHTFYPGKLPEDRTKYIPKKNRNV